MLHTLLYFLALLSLSSSPIWAKLNQMPVSLLGFYRLSIATILVLGWLIVRKKMHFKIQKNHIWAFASGFFFFLHLWTYKYAAKNTLISNTMIIFSSNPVWASMGAIFFFKEHFEKRLIISYLLALTSIYLLVSDNLNISLSSNLGDWSAAISAVFYAAQMLTGKKARVYFENTEYAFLKYLTCAVLFGLCLVGSDFSFTDYGPISWYAIVGLVVFPTLLGHFSLTYLINHMNLSLMTCGKLIEPVLASVAAYFIFNESLSQNAHISFALTSISVLILFGPSLKRKLF